MVRWLFVVALAFAMTACGQSSAHPLYCEATLGHGPRYFAIDAKTLGMKANAKASLKVRRYTIILTMLDEPANNRGKIRAELTGPNLPTGSSSEGGFDATRPGSFRGQATLPEGTLSYECGALGRA
jgi:hypothetical protein